MLIAVSTSPHEPITAMLMATAAMLTAAPIANSNCSPRIRRPKTVMVAAGKVMENPTFQGGVLAIPATLVPLRLRAVMSLPAAFERAVKHEDQIYRTTSTHLA